MIKPHRKKILNTGLLVLLTSFLSACGFVLTEDDERNAFLKPKDFEIDVKTDWVLNTGSGSQGAFLRLPATLSENVIYTTDAKGVISAVDSDKGKKIWRVNIKRPITSGAGVGDKLVYVGTGDGNVIAIDKKTGARKWRAPISGQILAAPVYSHGLVLAKTINGELFAFDSSTGAEKWRYGQPSPALVLRASSKPSIAYPAVVSGFADGHLAVMTLDKGSLLWEKRIAEPNGFSEIQRMVDIDSDPIVRDGMIYVAAFQGNVAALALKSGEMVWQHELSADSGMAATSRYLIVPDSKGRIWSFNRKTGAVNWRQNGVTGRHLSGATVLNNYIVTADDKGFIYWMDIDDGRFVAWQFVGNTGVITSPISDGKSVYVMTKNGQLQALKPELRKKKELT